jgi:hypothetical protein
MQGRVKKGDKKVKVQTVFSQNLYCRETPEKGKIGAIVGGPFL